MSPWLWLALWPLALALFVGLCAIIGPRLHRTPRQRWFDKRPTWLDD